MAIINQHENSSRHDEAGNVDGPFISRQPGTVSSNLFPIKMKALTFLLLCFASVALADDFKTTDGKEYKNVTVSLVEPDGIVLMTKSGISKVYFTELPKEVQERFNYDTAKGTAYSAEQVAHSEAFSKQRQESEQQRLEERKRYWSERPAPALQPQPKSQQGSSSNMGGTALDRPAYSQSAGSITPQFLVAEYAASEIKADNMYMGRIFTVSGTIKSIFRSGENVIVELYVPYYRAGTVSWMNCIFIDSSGLGQKTAGNPITLTGRVAGLRGNALTMEDCHL